MKTNKLSELLIPVSAVTIISGAVICAFKKHKKKNTSNDELLTRTQLLAVDYSEENLEEYIQFLQDKKLDRKNLSCLIEAYHLLSNYDVDTKYINDIKLILQMNGYMNPFKMYKQE